MRDGYGFAKIGDNRRSELLALLIDRDIPEFAKNEDTNKVVWAIYKSRIPFSKKMKLLMKYCDINSIDSAIEIAERMESPKILRSLIKRLEELKKANKTVL